MARKYGKNETTLSNVLKLVKALLALADEEIVVPEDKLKATFKVEWVKENELLVSGKVQEKRNNITKTVEKGITKEDLWILVECLGEALELAKPKDEEKVDYKEQKSDTIQDVIECLKDLKILDPKPSSKTQGFWKFHLRLHHQTAEKEKNLQVIKDKWKDLFKTLPQPIYPAQPTGILKYCILGLKGKYQEAQQKLSEITEYLQKELKDKTLSVKVEKGSILLIIESTQTGYEQLKGLIGKAIAGFPVEYAIDEWQNICRRMLIEQKPLTSNTVLGQAYANRNLIDEDLFVDLGLVTPKRSDNQKYSQDIDPEKGSQLYTREEIEKRFAYREFLDEIIGKRTEKNIAIIGEPGAGKTTLLQKLAFYLLQKTDDLVIWVDLGKLGNQPLGEYLEKNWLKTALLKSRDEIKADLEEKFKSGKVWLLLDGLDEMSESNRESLELRGWVMDAQMIITCRLNLWQANPSQLQMFQTYLTQPFQDEQVQEFIRRWFRGLVEEGEDVKLAALLSSELEAAGKERIKDLCRNPLRLTLLCATWKVDNALPATTAELYEGFVESIYEWKEEEFTVTDEEKEELNAGLGALAKASLEAETSRFRLTHGLVCKHLGKPKAQKSLFRLALKLGWLNEVGVAQENAREKVYGFYDATFQEYFAALAVDNWDDFLPKNHVDMPVEGKKYRIFEPVWKQVILLWLGRGDIADEKKEAFIQALVEFNDGVEDFYEAKAYFLAGAAINEFKACCLAEEIVRELVKLAFGYFNTEKQEWRTFLNPIAEEARKTLEETIRQLAITEIIQIIENCPDESTRREAAESLGQIDSGNPQAIACLISLIQSTDNQETRREAAESLGQIDSGNPQAIACLISLIQSTEDEDTRRRAAKSLGKIYSGNPQAIAGLISVIDSTEDEETRRQAAESLGQIALGNQEAIDCLIRVIESTDDVDTRREAAYSLGEIALGNPQAIAGLIRVIESTDDVDTRREAAESLGKIASGNQEAIACLIRVIESTEDEFVRMQAAESLGKIASGNPQAIACLISVIESTDNETNTLWIAAKSLGQIDSGNPQAIACLISVIESTDDIESTEDEFARWEAAISLGEIAPGNPQAIACLISVIESTDDIESTEDEFARMQAAYSLGKIAPGNPQAIAGLIRIIESTDDKNIRMWAAESLGEILTTPKLYADVVSGLKHCLSDEVYQNNFKRYDECYELIWKCTGNLPYPQFYQAWHHLPSSAE